MKKRGGESGDEDGGARGLVFGGPRFEKKRKRDEEAEQQSGEEGVKVSAIEAEIGGRAEGAAEGVEVGDGSGDEDG